MKKTERRKRKQIETQTDNPKGIEELSDQKLVQKITALHDENKNTVQQLPQTTEEPVEELQEAELIADTRKYMCRITGVRDDSLANMLICGAEQLLAHIKFPEDSDRLITATDLLEEMNPQNATECLLAIQMIGVHHAAIHSLKSANFGRSAEVCESFVRQSVRLMCLFNEQLEAMAKLKGKTGQQRVIVEHIHINAGGQAIVGTVATGKGNQGEGDHEEIRTNTP